MLYKWLGAGMLLLAGGYAAVSMNRLEQRRLAVLDGYIALIRYIKGQINCYAMPIGDILAAADPVLLRDCLGEGARHRSPLSTVTLASMIQAARLYLEPETERLLSNFSKELGHTFREEQVTRCDDYIIALGEERRKLAENVPMRERINSVLALSTALGMTILLW